MAWECRPLGFQSGGPHTARSPGTRVRVVPLHSVTPSVSQLRDVRSPVTKEKGLDQVVLTSVSGCPVMPRNPGSIFQAVWRQGLLEPISKVQRPVLIEIEMDFFYIFFCAFKYIFLFNSLFVISHKSFSRMYFLISYFYFFSTCFSNFSKTSSGLVEANSFTTLSRDLAPWVKGRRQCRGHTWDFLTPSQTDLGRLHGGMSLAGLSEGGPQLS